MNFPREHRLQIRSPNPLDRLNPDIKRGTHVVDMFPKDPTPIRWIGATMLEQNGQCSLNRRHMRP